MLLIHEIIYLQFRLSSPTIAYIFVFQCSRNQIDKSSNRKFLKNLNIFAYLILVRAGSQQLHIGTLE